MFQKWPDPTTPESSTVNNSVKILLFNGSPRRSGNSYELLKQAANALQEIPEITTNTLSLADKTILPCSGCHVHCTTAGKCRYDDDFDRIADLWLQADGILLGSPVYSFAPPAPVLAFFERLAALQKANPGKYFSPSWPQPVGILTQGGSEYGGVEICAQSLLSGCLSVGCVPVSGDMPGFSQGVIGQVADRQTISERLAVGAERLAYRVADLIRIRSAGQSIGTPPIRFLLVKVGEPPITIDSQVSVAFEALQQTITNELVWEWFDFGEQRIAPCEACTQYCSKDLECRFDDAMQPFRRKWFSADAVIWLLGSGAGASVSNFLAAIDRMNQVRFESFFASGRHHFKRHLTVSAGIVFGHDPLIAAANWQRINHIALLNQNLILPASRHSPGVLYIHPDCSDRQPQSNEHYESIMSLVEQSVRFALIARTGLMKLINVLPDEYYPDRS